MPLSDLTADEKNVVYECLKCVAEGEVILHDWEFETVMGVGVEDLQSVLDSWPLIDDTQQTSFLCINSSFANLLGYPHAFQHKWDSKIPVSREEVRRAFDKWKGR